VRSEDRMDRNGRACLHGIGSCVVSMPGILAQSGPIKTTVAEQKRHVERSRNPLPPLAGPYRGSESDRGIDAGRAVRNRLGTSPALPPPQRSPPM